MGGGPALRLRPPPAAQGRFFWGGGGGSWQDGVACLTPLCAPPSGPRLRGDNLAGPLARGGVTSLVVMDAGGWRPGLLLSRLGAAFLGRVGEGWSQRGPGGSSVAARRGLALPHAPDCLALLLPATLTPCFCPPCVCASCGPPLPGPRIACALAKVRGHGPGAASPPPILAHRQLGGACAQARGPWLVGGSTAGHRLTHSQSVARTPSPSLGSPSGVQGLGYSMLRNCRGQTPGWPSALPAAAGAVARGTAVSPASASALAGAAVAAGSSEWMRVRALPEAARDRPPRP